MAKFLTVLWMPVWAVVAKDRFFEFMWPLIPIYLLFALLVLVDLRLGVRAARKRGERVRVSRAARRTVSKYIDYLFIVTSCKLFDDCIVQAYSVPLVFVSFCLILAWVELDSIFSNFGELHGIRISGVIRGFLQRKTALELPERETRTPRKPATARPAADRRKRPAGKKRVVPVNKKKEETCN